MHRLGAAGSRSVSYRLSEWEKEITPHKGEVVSEDSAKHRRRKDWSVEEWSSYLEATREASEKAHAILGPLQDEVIRACFTETPEPPSRWHRFLRRLRRRFTR